MASSKPSASSSAQSRRVEPPPPPASDGGVIVFLIAVAVLAAGLGGAFVWRRQVLRETLQPRGVSSCPMADFGHILCESTSFCATRNPVDAGSWAAACAPSSTWARPTG